MPAERVAMRHVRETQERASPTNPQVQQQQQASAYSVRNGVERVPTLDPHANPVSEIHRPASRRTPGRDHPGIPGDIISERWAASSRNPRAASPESAPISVMNSRRLIAFPKAQDKAL